MCSCGRVPLLTNRHKRRKNVPKTATACLYLLGLSVGRLSVCLPVRFALGVRRVHRTDSDALGTDRRSLFMLEIACRDRRARPCRTNSYQWQLSLGFFTQLPRSLSSSKQHHHTHQRPPRPTITTTTTPPIPPSHHQLYRSFPGLMVMVAAAGGDGDDRSWWWWLQQVDGDGDDRL